MKKIVVMGLGYIGLPTASMFANHGFDVVGVDVKESIVKIINKGEIHIEEAGLRTLVKAAINSGNLRASVEPETADVFIIAVPTPLTADKKADLSYVKNAAEAVLPYLTKGNLVILESTVPPRTTMDMLVPILDRIGLNVGKELYVAHCPERVLPGKILKELVENNRVIGGIDEASNRITKKLYSSFVEGTIYTTDATTAEMTKLMENTFRDANIALANELAKICYQLGINVWEVAKLANKHPRVNIHQPGPGVGGHCLAVDPYFIVDKQPELARLISLARDTNCSMPQFVVDTLKNEFGGVSVITVFGITYKGNIDDVRESPALEVIDILKKQGFEVRIFDPHVKESGFELYGLEEALEGSDAILLLADHNEFKYLNPRTIGKLMNKRYVLDTKNCLDLSEWKEAGFKALLIGDGKQSDSIGVIEEIAATKEG